MQLAPGNDVEARALLPQQGEQRAVGVGFDGVADERAQRGKDAGHALIVLPQAVSGIDIQRRAEFDGEDGQ